MIINHNISALYAERMFSLNSASQSKNIEKLSSGMRINRASDDSAGLAVSEKMRSQIRGLNMASKNIQSGISFIQTAEGWLQETTMILQRMRELAVQSSNGIYTREDRLQIQTEIRQLVDEVDRISSQAEYNGLKLLKGGFRSADSEKAQPPADEKATANSAQRPIQAVKQGDLSQQHTLVNDGGGVAIHLGPNMDQREKVYIGNMSSAALGLSKGPVATDGKRELSVDYLSQDGANKAIGTIDSALFVVNRQRADLGGYQARLETADKGINVAAENLQASESYIRDTNVAKEMVNFVKNKILTETSASLLSQANMKPYIVGRLLESIK